MSDIDREDRDWIETLAGRGSDPEASSLRERILARSSEPIEPLPAADLAREAALVSRARREGLLPRRRKVRWSIVAAIVVLAVAVGILSRRPVESERVRGGTDGTFRIETADPAALQRTILDELRAEGVEATGYERLGRKGIDADLPQPLSPAVRRVLARHGIPPPEGGVLDVEIAGPPGR